MTTEELRAKLRKAYQSYHATRWMADEVIEVHLDAIVPVVEQEIQQARNNIIRDFMATDVQTLVAALAEKDAQIKKYQDELKAIEELFTELRNNLEKNKK